MGSQVNIKLSSKQAERVAVYEDAISMSRSAMQTYLSAIMDGRNIKGNCNVMLDRKKQCLVVDKIKEE